jgi:hypothetical protein
VKTVQTKTIKYCALSVLKCILLPYLSLIILLHPIDQSDFANFAITFSFNLVSHKVFKGQVWHLNTSILNYISDLHVVSCKGMKVLLSVWKELHAQRSNTRVKQEKAQVEILKITSRNCKHRKMTYSVILN